MGKWMAAVGRGSLVLIVVLAWCIGAPSGGARFGVPTLAAQGASDLEARHQRLLPLFELNGVVFTDADETRGRLVVGVLNRGLEQSVRTRLSALGIPSQSVDVVVSEPIVPVSALTLRDRIRPSSGGVYGGSQIRFSNYLCSVGFSAVRNGVQGFVTASHCSTRQGAVDSTQYYQPLNQVAADLVGTEIADPVYSKDIAGCPAGRKCRWSDANFSSGAAGAGFTRGLIAKTDGVNTGSLALASSNWEFQISAEGSATQNVTLANKVGRTTGWTRGTVTTTCANTGVWGSNIVLLCQDFVEANVIIVDSGDSGSPVFKINADQTVTLLGGLWGGSSSGKLFVYSPIANIQRSAELGALSTCVTSYGC